MPTATPIATIDKSTDNYETVNIFNKFNKIKYYIYRYEIIPVFNYSTRSW